MVIACSLSLVAYLYCVILSSSAIANVSSYDSFLVANTTCYYFLMSGWLQMVCVEWEASLMDFPRNYHLLPNHFFSYLMPKSLVLEIWCWNWRWPVVDLCVWDAVGRWRTVLCPTVVLKLCAQPQGFCWRWVCWALPDGCSSVADFPAEMVLSTDWRWPFVDPVCISTAAASAAEPDLTVRNCFVVCLSQAGPVADSWSSYPAGSAVIQRLYLSCCDICCLCSNVGLHTHFYNHSDSQAEAAASSAFLRTTLSYSLWVAFGSKAVYLIFMAFCCRCGSPEEMSLLGSFLQFAVILGWFAEILLANSAIHY